MSSHGLSLLSISLTSTLLVRRARGGRQRNTADRPFFWRRAERIAQVVDEDLLRKTLAHIAANIRRLRTEREMTQAELAEAASIDLRYLQRVEAGTVHAGAGYIAALALALDVEPGALFIAAEAAERPHGRPKTH